MKNFLDINKLETKELCSILEEASRIKAGRKGLTQGVLDPKPALSGQIVALIFEKPSTRTRISFAPPASISISILVAPASRQFSSTSFTTEAGRSTTSPAAI